MMQKSVWLAAAVSMIIAGEAHAQTTLEQLRAQASQQLGRLEVNLTLLESIEQQGTQLNDRNENLIERRNEANGEQGQLNSFCQGEFEEAEYNRRVAQCTTWQAGIDTRQNDIDNESASLDRQYADLQQRDEARIREGEQLLEAFTAATQQIAAECVRMPPGSAGCGPLPSAGPRTAEIWEWAQALLQRSQADCAAPNLERERMVECEQQNWDGSKYDESLRVLPDPQ